MRKFPGKVEMTKGKVHRRILNDEQKEWFRRWYPITENSRLAKVMGISIYKVRSFAQELVIEKSEKGLKAIKRRQVQAMVRTNEKNGCYDRKRGRPVSQATMDGRARRWDEERAGLRENVFLRMKREEPEKYKAWQEKRSVERRESIRKEKMRVVYGLERKTSLKAVVLCPYTRSQVAHRYNALRRGYVLTEDCSEGSPDRYIVYYDEDTKRNPRFEENLLKDGFQVRKWL